MARRTSQTAALVLGTAMVLMTACLTNVSLSPLGYGCSVNADCAGVGTCGDAGLCVLDAGAPDTAALFRFDHQLDTSQTLLFEPARIAHAVDGGGYTEELPALCAVATLGTSNNTPVFELQRPENGDWLFTSDPVERKSALSKIYDGGQVVFYAHSAAADAGVRVRRYEHLGFHRYTTTADEGTALLSEGWTEESILFGCDPL